MAYPTTLALITALWSDQPRTKSIALWSATGGAIAALGPLVAGALLEYFWWGSVFLVTLPLAAVALVLAIKFVPAHVNEETEPVDNLGGILSVLLFGALILAINFAPVPNEGKLVLTLVLIALAAGIAFIVRQRRATNPLYDLHVAGASDVLGRRRGRHHRVRIADGRDVHRSAVLAERARLLDVPLGTRDHSRRRDDGALAPRSAKLVATKGARFTLLVGYVFCFLGFLTMLLLWKEGIPYWKVGLGYAFIGIGVGFAGTPASHSLTGSVPVQRAGMASGTADLQRDLGGAIMQSILGALLTAGLRDRDGEAHRRFARTPQQVTDSTQSALTKSFSSATNAAQQYPKYADQIVAAAKTSFIDGQHWAYLAGIIADRCSAQFSCSSPSRSRSGRKSCSSSTTARTTRPVRRSAASKRRDRRLICSETGYSPCWRRVGRQGRTMDAIALLKADHKAVAKLFREYKAAKKAGRAHEPLEDHRQGDRGALDPRRDRREDLLSRSPRRGAEARRRHLGEHRGAPCAEVDARGDLSTSRPDDERYDAEGHRDDGAGPSPRRRRGNRLVPEGARQRCRGLGLKELGDEARHKRSAAHPALPNPTASFPVRRSLGNASDDHASLRRACSGQRIADRRCSTRRCPAVDRGEPFAVVVHDRGRARRCSATARAAAPRCAACSRSAPRRPISSGVLEAPPSAPPTPASKRSRSSGFGDAGRPRRRCRPDTRRRPSRSRPRRHRGSCPRRAARRARGAVAYSRVYNGVHYPGRRARSAARSGLRCCGRDAEGLASRRFDARDGRAPSRASSHASPARPSADGAGLTIVDQPVGPLGTRRRPVRRAARARLPAATIVALDDADDLGGRAARGGGRPGAPSASSAVTVRSTPRSEVALEHGCPLGRRRRAAR